jgi:hypothetical protein
MCESPPVTFRSRKGLNEFLGDMKIPPACGDGRTTAEGRTGDELIEPLPMLANLQEKTRKRCSDELDGGR